MMSGFMDEKSKLHLMMLILLKNTQIRKLIVYNPYVEFLHYESKSRGYEDTVENNKDLKVK